MEMYSLLWSLIADLFFGNWCNDFISQNVIPKKNAIPPLVSKINKERSIIEYWNNEEISMFEFLEIKETLPKAQQTQRICSLAPLIWGILKALQHALYLREE